MNPNIGNKNKSITVKFFGEFAIYVDGEEQSSHMNSKKARELIAFLLTYRGDFVKKTDICSALWEDSPKIHSMDSLDKLVKKIKAMPIPFIIEERRGLLGINCDNIDCDIFTFEELSRNDENIEKLEHAVSLYKGFLFEEDFNWIFLKEEFYYKRYVRALNCLCKHYTMIDDKKRASNFQILLDDCDYN